MNTHETYVSLETAKLLRQAGFDWECRYFYDTWASPSLFDDKTGELQYEKKTGTDLKNDVVCKNYNARHSDGTFGAFVSVPTLAVALRWLREVKHLFMTVDISVRSGQFTALIGRIDPYPKPDMPIVKWLDAPGDCYEYYEAAVEEGLAFALTRYCKKLTE